MRSLMCVLFPVLFCSVQMTSSAPFSFHVENCCIAFTNVKIPLKLVVSYYHTSSNCPMQAIVFQTQKGKKHCVDPESTWVNSHKKVIYFKKLCDM
uniref:C-C motif chemokine n=1 Tax=Sinocyclocheilus grahami TaxID=75366 RepID=A0A672RGA4_SINGR